jgi:hypothetical protein
LDLTVRRFRQIIAAIHRRQLFERRQQISLTSWQTRQLASFVAGGYMTDGKSGNPALDAAQRLAYDEIERHQLQEAEERLDRQDNLEFDEEGNIIPLLPNLKRGTAERFMGSFGNPQQWKK